jgi:hypothetical protein
MFGLVIVGGGPAGLAPLLAAHRDGRIDQLLQAGVALVEQSGELGAGQIGHYAINSDSSGRTFVDCLQADRPSELTRLADHPLTRRLAAAGDGAVELRDAGRFLGMVGKAIGRMIAAQPASAVFSHHRAVAAERVTQGWRIRLHDLATGRPRTVFARNMVIATGADQPAERLRAEEVGGVHLFDRTADRLVQSGDVLIAGGLQRVAERLAGRAAPKVAIIGGSTSAAAVAHALLHRLPSVRFAPGGVTLLHRRPLRIFYPDRQSALAEGYTEWTEDDICPVSGRVFRFAGFRLDSRELVMQARHICGRAPEPRLRLHQLRPGLDPEAQRVLESADLVVAAMGYRPRALPLFDRDGSPIPLLAQTGPQMAMVDGGCRVMDAQGLPIQGVYGIGLAAGFVPRGPLGGEPSFRGQANGLWLWQHDVGALIVDAVVPRHAAALPPAASPDVPKPANLNRPAKPRPASVEGVPR